LIESELKDMLFALSFVKICKIEMFKMLTDTKQKFTDAVDRKQKVNAQLKEIIPLPYSEDVKRKVNSAVDQIVKIDLKLSRLRPVFESRDEQYQTLSAICEVLRIRAVQLCDELLQLRELQNTVFVY